MSEENKAIVRRFYEELSAGRLDIIDELVAEDAHDHEEMEGFEGPPQGRERARMVFAMFRSAFPDMTMDLEDLIAEGDKVFTRATMRGTHQGELMGVAATGNEVAVPFGDYLRLVDGQIVEHWGVPDTGALGRQIGMPGA